MQIEAVLFDFAGTLAVPLPAHAQLRLVAPQLPTAEAERLAAALTLAGLPGGPYPRTVPASVAAAYAARDSDEAMHRTAYEALIATVVEAGTARRIYELVRQPAGWVAYPDALPLLDTLRSGGIRTGVITNVGFELRAVAHGLGVLERLDAWTSSARIGAAKPDPRLFVAAAAAIGVAPARCLVVGDHPEADGGGVPLGMRTLLLPMTSPGAPHGLDAVVRLALG